MKTDGNRSSWKRVTVAEVGADHVKLVQVDRTGTGGRVSASVVQRFERLDDAAAVNLATAVRRRRISRSPVVAALSRQVVNVRIIEIPSTNSVEIADMIELQIGKHTPYSREDVVSDYRILGPGRQQGYSRVMLAIAQSSILGQRFRLLEDAGLDVRSMTISSEGLLAWYGSTRTGGEGTALVLDVDSEHTDLGVFSNGVFVFGRSVLIGTRQLMDSPDLWNDKYMREIEQSLEACRSEAREITLGKAILAGAGPAIEGLRERIEARIGVPVETAGGLAGTAGRGDAGPGEAEGCSLTALVGFGISPGSATIAMVPESVRIRRGLEEKARRLTTLGSLAMTVLALGSALCLGEMNRKVMYLSDLRTVADSTAMEARGIERMKRTIVMVADRLDSRRSPLNMLLELHKIVPPGVAFDSISIDSGRKMTVKGRAKTYPDLDRLRGNLEASEMMFPKVDFPRQTMKPGAEVVEFELTCAVERRSEGEGD